MVSWRDQNRVFSIVKMIYTLTKAETSPDCNVRGWDKIPKFCPFEIYCSNGLNYFRKILIKKYGPFLAAGAIWLYALAGFVGHNFIMKQFEKKSRL